jgi:asparagine synthase (glutamine-hydrolysing)
MCGICGAITSRGARPAVERMTAALEHRGPDDSGLASLEGEHGASLGWFGHRRLSILDLSIAGHQPMSSPDGRYCLTYNGEIYNFRELRDELAHAGASFHSTGDTAVLLAGWARWGPRVLPKLRGMYAFALWDRDEQKCYLARDSFGIKPLYFSISNGIVLFASEIRSLLASEMIPRVIDPHALESYLATGSVAEPLTIISSIEAVPAGTYVTIDGGVNPVVRRSEPFADALPRETIRESGRIAETLLELRQAMRDSVAHHLVSDVPVALFLSGGLDSSSVVAVASEVSDTRLDTFTVTFDEAEFSEAAPAREVARKFNTLHHEIPLSARDLLGALPEAFAAMDQPSLDGLNTYVVSRAVRENGIKVVLSGLGGDELFAGYPSFRRALRAEKLWRFRAAARPVLAAGRLIHNDPRLERLQTLVRSDSPALGAYVASRTLFSPSDARALTGAVATDRAATAGISSAAAAGLSTLQQVTLYELTGYMRNTLLRDSDVFSMAHGLELRVPFVDREVARVAMRFADADKVRGRQPKPILARTLGDLLPPSLLSRPKQGFTLPFERWMRKELLSAVDRTFASQDIPEAGLDPNASRRVWSEFQRGTNAVNWSRPWALYTLARWAEQNDVTAREPGQASAAQPMAAAR